MQPSPVASDVVATPAGRLSTKWVARECRRDRRIVSGEKTHRGWPLWASATYGAGLPAGAVAGSRQLEVGGGVSRRRAIGSGKFGAAKTPGYGTGMKETGSSPSNPPAGSLWATPRPVHEGLQLVPVDPSISPDRVRRALVDEERAKAFSGHVPDRVLRVSIK